MGRKRAAGPARQLPNDLIKLQTAARIVGEGVHPKTIRRWINLGLLEGYRQGPRLLFVSKRELLSVARPLGATDGAA